MDGIRSAGGLAVSAARSVADKVAALLPGSPIKEGPLKSWNNGGAGKRLMEFLAYGIKKDTSVDRAMNQVVRNIDVPSISVSDVVGKSWDSVSRGVGSLAAQTGGGLPGSGGTKIIQNTYAIDMNVPVGGSSVEIGRTLVKHISEFEKSGGRKPS
jgi:hypothetical protein